MILFFAACSSGSKKHPSALATKTPTPENDYRILPADVLQVNVFQEQDLKSVVRVTNEGTIVFPLIGRLAVQGMTVQETAHMIQERLAKGYLVNPQVSVSVIEFSKRRFTVLGEVQKPGSYDMPDQEDVTVLQAIGMAGGYTRIANPSSVTLMRRTNGKAKTFNFNAKRMASGHGESAFKVLSGDVITVSESMF